MVCKTTINPAQEQFINSPPQPSTKYCLAKAFQGRWKKHKLTTRNGSCFALGYPAVSSCNHASKSSIDALQKTGTKLYGAPWTAGLTGVSMERGTTNCFQSRRLCKLLTSSDSDQASRSLGHPGSSMEISGTKLQPEPGLWGLTCSITEKTTLARFKFPSFHQPFFLFVCLFFEFFFKLCQYSIRISKGTCIRVF